MKSKQETIWVVLRITLGLIFLWSAIDKIFGLGFPTEPDSAWLTSGTSPTFGYLNFAAYGPMSALMQSIAGNVMVDVLFVGGQLLIGLSLVLGIGLRIAGFAGALQLLLIYISRLPPERNPLVDQHIVYAVILIGIAVIRPGRVLGLGKRWMANSLVKRFPILA